MSKRVLLILAGCLLFSQPSTAQWVQTNGPYGGNVNCFAAIGTTMFAGLYGGLFRSTDSGTTWTAASKGIPPQREQPGPYVYSLAAMGTNLFETSGDGVFRSTDSGRSWTYAGLSIVGNGISKLAVSGSNLYAAGFGNANGANFFRSTDSGASWTADSIGQVGNYVYSLGVIGRTLLAGTWYGLFRSTDDGMTWTECLILRQSLPNVNAFAVCGPYLFAGSAGLGVFRSSDSGKSWMSTGPADVQAMAASETAIYTATRDGLFLSRDSGESWNEAASKPTTLGIQALAAHGSDLFSGDPYFGVFRSTDCGTTWATASSGLMPLDVSALAVSGAHLFAGTNVGYFAGLFQSNNFGANWMLEGDSIGKQSPIALVGNSTSIYMTTNAGVFRSTDAGSNWTDLGLDSLTIGTFAINGSTLFAGVERGQGLFRSTDDGSSWENLGVLSPSIVITDLVANGTNIIVGTYDSGVYISSDNGTSWRAASAGITSSSGNPNQVEALAVMGDNLFAGIDFFVNMYGTSYPVGSGVFRSSDGGASWNQTSAGIPGNSINSFAINGTNLFVGAAGGVFLTTDIGTTWIPVTEGLADTEAGALTILDGDLYVATYHAGVWRRPLSEMIPTSAVSKQPKAEQSAIQAYPNPSSSKTTVRFTTAERGPVQVSVVNLLGVEVARLFSGELDVGEHSFVWDARAGATGGSAAADATDGTYFCIVQSNAGVQRVAMLLQK